MLSRDALLPKIQQAYAFAETQLRRLITDHPDQFPLYTTSGKWDFTSPSWTNWCEGFLGGQLWLLSLHNPAPRWRSQAEHYSQLLEPRKHDRAVHDPGFLFPNHT